jgi:glycosyltransferase involved in cell wall biosynthesis
MPAGSSPARICLVPRLSGLGGMVSFQHKLAAGLAQRQIEVTYDLDDPAADAILVIGGTRQVAALWRARRRGVRIVQRLDGMNWLHRRQPTPLKAYLRAELNNVLLAIIRRNLAGRIVYQSNFSRAWWERVHGDTRVPNSVVYNGVDLQAYSPDGPQERPGDRYRLLLVEGHLGGGYQRGLENAAGMAQRLAEQHGLAAELMVVGDVPASLQSYWTQRSGGKINWAGVHPREEIPVIDRSAHLLFSADLNAACPNSVIEALACGLPVVAFDTGALGELVKGGAGEVVPYGGDPWKLEASDLDGLASAAAGILMEQESYRRAARARAEAAFGLEGMLAGYLEALLG